MEFSLRKKGFYISIAVLLIHLSISAYVFAQKGNGYKIMIDPNSAILNVGETQQFSAVLTRKNGAPIDTTFTWSVDATGVGSIHEGLFTAVAPGRCYVYASAGNLTGKAHVTVQDTVSGSTSQHSGSYLEISPEDTLILIGETIQYTAYLTDSLGNRHDTTAVWELYGNEVGTISMEGLLSADDKGTGLIKATVGEHQSITKVFVSSAEDTASCDSLRIRFRDRDGIQHGYTKRCAENDIFKISGLTFPFNLLNGGEIIFPAGSLDENIEIEISLPDCAIIEDSTVTYQDQILNGISFQVYINGELVSPYYFDEPVDLILPYKKNLLNTLNLSPEDLWIFFYTDSKTYDGQGISNIVVDTETNKIYAKIAHFSDLVVGNKDLITTSIFNQHNMSAEAFTLYGNYPNPFNPITHIRFALNGSIPQKVEITIYNLLGKEVRSLLSETIEPGFHAIQWDGKDNRGSALGSGIYFYRLKTSSGTKSQRMILLK